MNKVKRLDLEYQYAMLAYHAKELIMISDIQDSIFSEHLEPLKKRLEVIRKLQDESAYDVFMDVVSDGWTID